MIKHEQGLFRSILVIKVNTDFILFELDTEFNTLRLVRISISEDGINYTMMSQDELNGVLFLLNTNIINLVDYLAKYMNKEVILRLNSNQFCRINGFI